MSSSGGIVIHKKIIYVYITYLIRRNLKTTLNEVSF